MGSDYVNLFGPGIGQQGCTAPNERIGLIGLQVLKSMVIVNALPMLKEDFQSVPINQSVGLISDVF